MVYFQLISLFFLELMLYFHFRSHFWMFENFISYNIHWKVCLTSWPCLSLNCILNVYSDETALFSLGRVKSDLNYRMNLFVLKICPFFGLFSVRHESFLCLEWTLNDLLEILNNRLQRVGKNVKIHCIEKIGQNFNENGQKRIDYVSIIDQSCIKNKLATDSKWP